MQTAFVIGIGSLDIPWPSAIEDFFGPFNVLNLDLLRIMFACEGLEDWNHFWYFTETVIRPINYALVLGFVCAVWSLMRWLALSVFSSALLPQPSALPKLRQVFVGAYPGYFNLFLCKSAAACAFAASDCVCSCRALVFGLPLNVSDDRHNICLRRLWFCRPPAQGNLCYAVSSRTGLSPHCLAQVDVTIDCQSPVYAAFKSAAWAAFFAYCLGFPAMLYLLQLLSADSLHVDPEVEQREQVLQAEVLMWQQQEHPPGTAGHAELKQCETELQEVQDVLRDARRTEQLLGFITIGHRPHYGFWESCMLLFKFAITSISVMLPQQSQYTTGTVQLLTSFLICLVFFAIHHSIHAYATIQDNDCLTFALLGIALTLFQGMALEAESAARQATSNGDTLADLDAQQHAVTWILISSQMMLLGTFVWLAFKDDATDYVELEQGQGLLVAGSSAWERRPRYYHWFKYLLPWAKLPPPCSHWDPVYSNLDMEQRKRVRMDANSFKDFIEVAWVPWAPCPFVVCDSYLSHLLYVG